jgi:hypothetical protein
MCMKLLFFSWVHKSHLIFYSQLMLTIILKKK